MAASKSEVVSVGKMSAWCIQAGKPAELIYAARTRRTSGLPATTEFFPVTSFLGAKLFRDRIPGACAIYVAMPFCDASQGRVTNSYEDIDLFIFPFSRDFSRWPRRDERGRAGCAPAWRHSKQRNQRKLRDHSEPACPWLLLDAQRQRCGHAVCDPCGRVCGRRVQN